MKRYCLFLIILIGMVILGGCTSSNTNSLRINNNLLRETWMSQMNRDPSLWTRTGDRWFFSGEPNQTERDAIAAGNDQAMTVQAVKVPQFTNINIIGSFQVQIAGEQDQNSVYIVGPNSLTRQAGVEVSGNTLTIRQIRIGDTCCENLNAVIVRIGIHNLRCLNVEGVAHVEGRNILSDRLTVESSNNGDILLAGFINLRKVNNNGAGTISIIGARAPNVIVNAYGSGTVNISGRVGVNRINHFGSGEVNIIGADTNALAINSGGNGLTSVLGCVGLRNVTAVDYSHVFVQCVRTNIVSVLAKNCAEVGLSGYATNADITLMDGARFYGGSLRAGSVYIKTFGDSHANIAANGKIFIAANDQSSIYYYGSTKIASTFTTSNSSVIPVWPDNNSWPASPVVNRENQQQYLTKTQQTYGN
ncbi:MAG: DUF2807 domain-containing protein [Gammaproteobacteria bacterium]